MSQFKLTNLKTKKSIIIDERLSPMTYKKLKELGYNSDRWKNLTQEEANRIVQKGQKSGNSKSSKKEEEKKVNKNSKQEEKKNNKNSKQKLLNKLKSFETDDYQKRNGRSVKSNAPDTIQADERGNLNFSFNGAKLSYTEKWVNNFLKSKGLSGEVHASETGDYEGDWQDVYVTNIKEINNKSNENSNENSKDDDLDYIGDDSEKYERLTSKYPKKYDAWEFESNEENIVLPKELESAKLLSIEVPNFNWNDLDFAEENGLSIPYMGEGVEFDSDTGIVVGTPEQIKKLIANEDNYNDGIVRKYK